MTKTTIISAVFVCMFIITPFASFHGDLAEAEEFVDFSAETGESYPYTKTYSISAYYSPLPCQSRYATGTYAADIRLNGNGTNGADGTPVYPGMVAAPKTYSFGTKMYIPGVGIVAVHDRGGAIVASSGENGLYDRLDIWMGYGDKGLTRALNWGKRNVDVTVYGVNDSVVEQISLDNYSSDEAVPQVCEVVEAGEPVAVAEAEAPGNVAYAEVIDNSPSLETQALYDSMSQLTFQSNLSQGAYGESVYKLQEELDGLNYYKSGYSYSFDDLTKHAVFKFQQSQGIVDDLNSEGAGVFGPQTRDRMNEIILARNYSQVAIAKATSDYNGGQSQLLAEYEGVY